MEGLMGPPGYNRFAEQQTAAAARQSYNIDRSGALSGFAVIGLLGILLASSLVFGMNWNTLVERSKSGGVQEAIEEMRATFENLTTTVNQIPTQCDCEGVNITFPREFFDGEFGLFDSNDTSRIAVFDVSDVSASGEIPHPLIVREKSGSETIAYLSEIPTFPVTFADDEFQIFSAAQVFTRIEFNCSEILSGVPTVLGVQDKNGTVAYLSNIEDPTNTTVFSQDFFDIVHANDASKRVVFDVDAMVPSGTTIVMTVPDGDGTIAYTQEILQNFQFPDDEFELYSDADDSKRVRFNASNAVENIPTVMTIQNVGGTIAYKDQLEEFQDASIDESRTFPHPDYEGVDNFQDLAATELSIWMCGTLDLVIDTPSDNYDHFEIELGGDGGFFSPCSSGNDTVITLHPADEVAHDPHVVVADGGRRVVIQYRLT